MRFRKKIEREEKQNTESEILEVKVNEQLVLRWKTRNSWTQRWWRKGEKRKWEKRGKRFALFSRQDTTTKASSDPTTTKWVHRVKNMKKVTSW